jgi:hypothetical protein
MRTLLITSTFLLASIASPVAACRVGGDRILFERPPTNVPVGMKLYRGRFTNAGREFERWRGRAPATDGGQLVGVLKQPMKKALPVYHPVTSCTHGFFGIQPEEFDHETFLVGRLVGHGGWSAIYAAGDWNGTWSNVP